MLILKTKSLTSENLFKRETREVDDMFMNLLTVFQVFYDHAPDSEKQTLRRMLDLILLLSEQVHTSHRQAESSIGDFKVYITALEGSYKNVDGDFDKTVAQPAEREAEEKDGEEEERPSPRGIHKRARPKFYE
jgi:hypothetical protein